MSFELEETLVEWWEFLDFEKQVHEEGELVAAFKRDIWDEEQTLLMETRGKWVKLLHAQLGKRQRVVSTYLRAQVEQLTWRKKTELFLTHFSVFSPSGGTEFPGGLYRPNWWELERETTLRALAPKHRIQESSGWICLQPR